MPVNYPNHPSGNVYLDERIVNLLLPLLLNQSFINKSGIYQGEDIDIDLDFFREIPIDIRFHSVRWYMHLTGIHTDMNLPFVESKEHELIRNNIKVETHMIKNCDHHIPIEASSLALNYIKKNFKI